MPAAMGKVPAVLLRPPAGIDAQHPINALATHGDPSGELTAPAKFWVQHSLYPTLKKACGTKDAPGIRKQNASRVLSELRQARSVVETQLEDFHRGLLDLDAWLTNVSPPVQLVGGDGGGSASTTDEVRERRKKKRRRKVNASTSELPGETAVDLAPSFDVDAMDMDAPCTTSECWQYLRASSFFAPVTRDVVEHILAPLPTTLFTQPDECIDDGIACPTYDDPSSTRACSLSEKLLAALVDVHGPSPTTSAPDEGDDEGDGVRPSHDKHPLGGSHDAPPSYPATDDVPSTSKLQHELALVGLVRPPPPSVHPPPSSGHDAGDVAAVFGGAPDVESRLAQATKACLALHASTNAIKASLRDRVHLCHHPRIDHKATTRDDHAHVVTQYRKLSKRKADDARRKLRRTAKATSARKQQQQHLLQSSSARRQQPLDHRPPSGHPPDQLDPPAPVSIT